MSVISLFEDSLLKKRKCVIHIIMTYIGEVKLHYKQVQWNFSYLNPLGPGV